MNISMRRSNTGDAKRALNRMGGGICYGPWIFIPRNATPIRGGGRLLDSTGFLVRISEQVVVSSVKS